MTAHVNHSVISRRLLLLGWCLVLVLLTRSEGVSANTCAEEEKACKTRCGTGSEYDFDCDDTQDGARAFSCACRSTGEWSEVAMFPSGFDTPLTFDSSASSLERNTVTPTNTSQDTSDYCTRERSLCAALCANGTEPDFDCKDETAKDGSSSSQASACACKTSSSSSKTSIDSNTSGGVPTLPKNGTCETSRVSCQQSCPEGSKAEFTCESRSTNDGKALDAFSGTCVCLPLDATQDGPLSGRIQANNEVPTDAGFASGAKYAIQYMMASLIMLQAAMGIEPDGE